MTALRHGLGLALLAATACASSGELTRQPPSASQAAAREVPQLRAPSELALDFMFRQRVTAVWPGRTQSFDAVLQKRGDELLLVGLSPLGQTGFVLRLRSGHPLEVENHMGQPLPFPPEYILADVQRVFFPWLPAPAASFSGEREGQRDGVHIVERLHEGVLERRTFTRSGDAAQAIEIRYEGAHPGDDAAPRVVLDNGWYRYRLIIETIEQTRLRGSP